MKDFRFYTQISTSHSSEEGLTPAILRKRLEEVRDVLPFSGLIVGSFENRAVFEELTRGKREDDPEIYLWYNLLSDYPGQDEAESVITYKGGSCKKWFGWGEDAEDEVSESFMFSCPNDPVTRQKTLKGLANLLDRYPFDGVFLDKFRFPSPASGLDLTFSCFCPHCYEKAAGIGLDLDEVKAELQRLRIADGCTSERPAGCLEAVIAGSPVLQKFLRFRIDSVLDIVREVRALTDSRGVKLSLDLYSPAYAPLVGYDLSELAKLADWVKPMTYQFANGPAGLRLETTALFEGIEKEYGVPEEAAVNKAAELFPWFTAEKYAALKESAVPMEWIESEMRTACEQMSGIPVCFGLECVSFPGVINVKPDEAAALLDAAMRCGGEGAVLSWDLMHMPMENLYAMRSVYDGR